MNRCSVVLLSAGLTVVGTVSVVAQPGGPIELDARLAGLHESLGSQPSFRAVLDQARRARAESAVRHSAGDRAGAERADDLARAAVALAEGLVARADAVRRLARARAENERIQAQTQHFRQALSAGRAD